MSSSSHAGMPQWPMSSFSELITVFFNMYHLKQKMPGPKLQEAKNESSEAVDKVDGLD